MRLALLAALLALPIFAQDNLPGHFVYAGVGFHGTGIDTTASQKPSGVMGFCDRQGDSRAWLCIRTDHSSGTTGAQGRLFVLAKSWRYLYLFGDAGAGAASGANTFGGSFFAGGALMADASKLFGKGVYAGVSVGWLKQDVSEFTGVANFLRTFGSKTAINVVVGKGF